MMSCHVLLDEGTGEQRYEDLEEADLRLLPREMDPQVAVEEEGKPRPVGGSDRGSASPLAERM